MMQHDVVASQQIDGWRGVCATCDWRYEGTSPSITLRAAQRHVERSATEQRQADATHQGAMSEQSPSPGGHADGDDLGRASRASAGLQSARRDGSDCTAELRRRRVRWCRLGTRSGAATTRRLPARRTVSVSGILFPGRRVRRDGARRKEVLSMAAHGYVTPYADGSKA